jgi:hypothetical protein
MLLGGPLTAGAVAVLAPWPAAGPAGGYSGRSLTVTAHLMPRATTHIKP